MNLPIIILTEATSLRTTPQQDLKKSPGMNLHKNERKFLKIFFN